MIFRNFFLFLDKNCMRILIWFMALCFLIGIFMFGVLVIGTLMFMWKPFLLMFVGTYLAYRLAEFKHKRMKS